MNFVSTICSAGAIVMGARVPKAHKKNEIPAVFLGRDTPRNDMDLAWKVPQRYVARRPSPNGPGWEVLVKWTHLGYDQCTWEVRAMLAGHIHERLDTLSADVLACIHPSTSCCW